MLKNANAKSASDLSRDGRFLLYTEIDPKDGADIWYLPDPLNPGASISAGVQGVQRLIAAAQSRGARVMVGTLLPQISADLTHGGTPLLIGPFNAQLVPAATNAGARVVDLFSDIAIDVTDWISPYDGLHPTEAGYQELARAWLTTHNRPLPLPPTPAGPTTARHRRSVCKL